MITILFDERPVANGWRTTILEKTELESEPARTRSLGEIFDLGKGPVVTFSGEMRLATLLAIAQELAGRYVDDRPVEIDPESTDSPPDS